MSTKQPDPALPHRRAIREHARHSTVEISGGSRPHSFMEDVRVDYGPNDVLTKLFIAADGVLQDNEVVLSFASFEELVAVNQANRDSWLPLNPTFDPKNGNVGPDCAFTLLGRNRSGRVVTAQAMRIFDWPHTNFKKEAESLRLLYANPPCRAGRPGCEVTAPSAHSITGRVGYGGAVWLHPSVRGRRMVSSMSRIGRAYALTRWQIDIAFGVTSTGGLASGFIGDAGFVHEEKGIAFADPKEGPLDAALFWITSAEMIQDFAAYSARTMQPSRNRLQLGNAE
jgi:hypothetical protein